MNYGQIQQYLAIAKHLSLTKAAKELYITQPALSHSLAKMEEELGVRLFHRDGNRMVLTSEGEALLKDFKKINDSFESMYKNAEALSASKEEKIVVGFSGSALIFASLFISGFLSSFNGIPINKVFANREQVEEMLKNNLADFAITYPPISGPSIGSRVLSKEELVLALSERHPLARKKTITMADIGQYPFTVLTRAHHFRRNCDHLLRQEGVKLLLKSELDYADFSESVKSHRGMDDFITFTTENSFNKWYGDGYACRFIENCSMFQTTGVSWKIDGTAQYKYKGLLEALERNYREVYDNSEYHSFMI